MSPHEQRPRSAFGDAMRSLRKTRGISLRSLATQVNYDFGYLGQIERGDRRPTASIAAAVDLGLGAGGMLIKVFEDVAVEGEMQRRAVLRGLTALAMGAPPLTALEAVRQGISQAVDGDVDAWRQVVEDYGRAFYVTGPDEFLERLGADLTVLQTMIAARTSVRQRALIGVAAQLSVLVAMTLSATGRTQLASRWWSSARLHAEQSDDVAVRVFVGSWSVVSALYEGKPPASVLDQADGVVRLAANRADAAVAGLLAGRAQALALAGRGAEAVRAIDAVRQVSDRVPTDLVGDAESLFGWPEHRLRHTESFVFTHVGEVPAALAAQDRALELYPAVQARLRAQVMLHRAQCLLGSGDVAGGLGLAAQVIDGLPHRHHNEVLYKVVAQVIAAIPERERRRNDALALYDRVPGGRRQHTRSSRD